MSKLDEIEKQLNQTPKNPKDDKILLHFFLGIILLGAGIFMVCKNTYIVASIYTWHVGRLSISSGLVAIPILVGIGMLFYDSKSFLAKIIILVGAVFLLISIIMSVRIHFRTTDLYTYILMFGSIFAGAGLLMRVLIKGGRK